MIPLNQTGSFLKFTFAFMLNPTLVGMSGLISKIRFPQ